MSKYKSIYRTRLKTRCCKTYITKERRDKAALDCEKTCQNCGAQFSCSFIPVKTEVGRWVNLRQGFLKYLLPIWKWIPKE